MAQLSSSVPAPIEAADLVITQSDRKTTQALLWALKPLGNLRGSILLPFVTSFLTVAADEGKGGNAYARAMGIRRAAMSRYLRDIGDRARNGGPGFGLVTVADDPADPVRSRVFLTPKGRSIAKQIFRQIRKGEKAAARSAGEL
jgi:DNA-binding MarR family transcriptional regulator